MNLETISIKQKLMNCYYLFFKLKTLIYAKKYKNSHCYNNLKGLDR